MRILHFALNEGEERGIWMKGVEEYVIITDESEEDRPIEDDRARGFALESQTEIEELPCSFPVNTTLIPHR